MLTPKARLASSRDKTQKQRDFMFNQPKKQKYFIWNPQSFKTSFSRYRGENLFSIGAYTEKRELKTFNRNEYYN
jgi:hypothetical protein